MFQTTNQYKLVYHPINYRYDISTITPHSKPPTTVKLPQGHHGNLHHPPPPAPALAPSSPTWQSSSASASSRVSRFAAARGSASLRPRAKAWMGEGPKEKLEKSTESLGNSRENLGNSWEKPGKSLGKTEENLRI